MKHFSIKLPEEVRKKLASAAANQELSFGPAVRLILKGFKGGIAKEVILGYPALEPYLDVKWQRFGIRVDDDTRTEIQAVAVQAGVQRPFVVGVLLVAHAGRLEERIAAGRDAAGRGDSNHNHRSKQDETRTGTGPRTRDRP